MKYKEEIKRMMESDYEAFCKALFAIEFGVKVESELDKMYQRYMDRDTLTLLDEDIKA